MKISDFEISDLKLIEPQVFADSRGYFMETFNREKFVALTGISEDWVQDNESKSDQGVLRGFHFQKPPHAQAKLVRVIQGEVLDVVVDIRIGSPTFGKHVAVTLSAENKCQFYIPEGFAHGFLVKRDDTIFAYKCSRYYHKESEVSLKWNDPVLNIDWGINSPILSEKDSNSALNLVDVKRLLLS